MHTTCACVFCQSHVSVKAKWNGIYSFCAFNTVLRKCKKQHYHSLLDFYPPLLGVKIDYLLSAEREG